MKQSWLKDVYDTIGKHTPNIESGEYINRTLHAIAEVARETFAADICVFIAINPITNRIISPIVTAGELSLEKATYPDNAVFYDTNVKAHIQQKGIWFTEEKEVDPDYQSTFADREDICSTAAVVLQIEHNQSYGLLYLHFRQQHRFQTEERHDIQIFAEQSAALLLELWLHFHYSQIENVEQEINQNLTHVEDLFEKLQLYLTRVLDTSYSLLLAVYPLQGNTFNVFVNEGEHIVTALNSYSIGGACRYAIDTQETFLIKHLSKEADQLACRLIPVEGTQPKEFYIFLPLILRGETFGVLSIQHAEPNAYNEKNLPALKLLANHIALALRNISLYNNLHRLNTTGQVLMDLLDSEQLLQSIVAKIQEDTLADIVVLYPYEEKKQTFVLPPLYAGELSSTLLERMYPKRSDDIVHLMLQQDKAIFARDSSTLYSEYLQGDLSVRQGSFEERENIKSTAAVTMRSGSEILGILFLNFRQAQRFDAPQKLFIAVLTNYATFAIRSAQFIGMFMKRRTHEQEVLKQIDQEVNHTLDLDHVLMTILEQAKALLQADEASILLYDKELQVLEARAALPGEADQGQIITLQDAKGITLQALTRKEAILVQNVYDAEWRDLYIPTGSMLNCIAELDVPLIDEDEVVGVLNFESIREGAFNSDDKKFLEVLAGHTVLAVKRARDYDIQKRLAQEEAALHQISKEIIGQFDSDVSFRIILQHALNLTNASIGSLHLYDPETQKLTIVVDQGAYEEKKCFRQDLGQGIVGLAALKRKPINIDERSALWKCYIPFSENIRSELAVPMIGGKELRGVLNVESTTLSFNKNDEKLLVGLANLAVVALEHAERHQNALREKKRFELLYKAAQALGNLSEMEHLNEAYTITQEIAEEYGQQPTNILQRDDHLPPDTHEMLVFHISFNHDHYGYLVLSSQSIHIGGKIDRTFFDGLTQQLASTIYRIETTYSKREHEAKALMTSLILEVVHRSGNRLGLVTSYVNDIRNELKRLEVPITQFMDKRLNRITQSIERIRTMNKDVMRSMENVLPAKTESISSIELFQEVEREVKNVLAPTTGQITITIEENSEEFFIYAIRSGVVNILYNLMTNAIEAMPQGGTITLKAFKEPFYIALEVSDTGIGIPPDRHEKIFFFGYTTKESTGFGLWNALCEARINHGELKLVSSRLNKGSTFRLLLPNAESRRSDGGVFYGETFKGSNTV